MVNSQGVNVNFPQGELSDNVDSATVLVGPRRLFGFAQRFQCSLEVRQSAVDFRVGFDLMLFCLYGSQRGDPRLCFEMKQIRLGCAYGSRCRLAVASIAGRVHSPCAIVRTSMSAAYERYNCGHLHQFLTTYDRMHISDSL